MLCMWLKIFSSEYTLEELLKLKKQKLITQETYEILKEEIESGGVENGVYSLKINGEKVSNLYSVLEKDKRFYLNVDNFLELIKLENHKKEKNRYKIYLGENLEEIILDFENNRVFKNNIKVELEEKEWYFLEGGQIFISKNLFSELFLNFLDLDRNTLEMSMYLSFSTPSEISELLFLTEEKLNKQKKINELIYRDEKKLFDLGYARVKMGESFTKLKGEKEYKSKWDGKFEYQGGALFGEILFDYDLKEQEFGNIQLGYKDIWKEHSLDIINRKSSKKRQWGLSFYKDKGYYNLGNKIIIRENVPVGSRGELIYMGTPIAVENEMNGEVVFFNDMIKSDRDYQLKIYTPDGKILIKDIKTVENYNRQSYQETQYNFIIDENEERYATSGEILYGITNNLTIGGGFLRDIVDMKNSGRGYFNEGDIKAIYGGVYNGISYSFMAAGERAFSNKMEEYNKSLKDRKKYEFLNDIRYGKYKLYISNENKGKYYNEKNIRKYEFQYDVLKNMRLTYSVEDIEKYDFNKKEKKSSIGINNDISYKRVLIGTDMKLDLEDSNKNEYNLNTYYNGWGNMTVKLENKWKDSGKNYESALTLYNNNFKGLFDFSTEFRYTKDNKDMLTFKFSMDIDSWLKLESFVDKDGSRDFRVGIDKVIDLKHPKEKLESIDVSRVKIITFIDDNNNNILDNNEIGVEGVEVEIGNKKITTNQNGEGLFYGISNGVIHSLKPKIKKPSYSIGNNEIKVISRSSSTVDVFIPIKPMINLSGYIDIAENLGLGEEEKEEFYSNILIDIKDNTGETIELVAPDNTGLFDISGLFPETYILEVSYLGSDYSIKSLKEKMKLSYNYNDYVTGFEHKLTFNISNKQIKISKL